MTEQSYYGNLIKDEIKLRLDNKWEPSPGMIYPLLRNLESEGYIDGWWDEPDRRSIKRYKITDLGLSHYKTLLLQNKPAFNDSLIIIQNSLKDIYKEKI